MGICLGRFIQNLFLKSRYQSRNKLLKPVFAQFNTLGRPCPASTADLQLVFTNELIRTQRRSDGTISLGGVRFEIPSRYGHFQRVSVRVAAWDLSRVHLCDSISGAILGC